MKGRKIIVQKAVHAKNNKRAFHIIKTHACCYKWFIINVYYKRSITNEFIIVALFIIKQMFIHAYQNGKSRGSTNTITTPIMT